METCSLRTGQIIDHRCSRRAVALCSECGQPRCGRHLDSGLCVACLGTHRPPTARTRLEDLDLDALFAADLEGFDGRGEDLPRSRLDGAGS